MKRIAFGLLWLALIAGIGWTILNAAVLHQTPGLDLVGGVVTAYFVGFAVLRARWRWMAVVARLLMAIDFLLSVGDRFGLFGPAGSPGVSWGDFANFVTYTHQVNAFLPVSFAPVLAVLATTAEIVLGTMLLIGLLTRLAALGAAGLTLLYGTAMTLSGMIAGQFHYTVFVLCTAMLALATVDSGALSVDALVRRLWRSGSTTSLKRSAGASPGSSR